MTDTDIQFLIPFLFDGENVVQRSPGSSASDLTRKVHHVFDIVREDPAQVRPRDVADIVYDPNSQIGAKKDKIAHYLRVASLTSKLVTVLSEKHPGLDLPAPAVAYTIGLVHDISNAFARYSGTFKQEEKELSLYHLARQLDVPLLQDAAQHNAYLEIASMIAAREGFANVGKYSAWSAAYNDLNNPHNIFAMFAKYGNPHAAVDHDFAHGQDNFGLMALCVTDCLDDGRSYRLDLDNKNDLATKFSRRMTDIKARYYDHNVEASKSPTAFGVALVEKGGLQRMESYLRKIQNLVA